MQPGETHMQVRALMWQFENDVIPPVAGELDRTSRFPTDFHSRRAELDLFGQCIPEGPGGPRLDTEASALVMEELVRGRASIADQRRLVKPAASLFLRPG